MANPFRKYLDPHVLAELRGLEIRAQRIVDGILSGRHRSRARGMSNEFVQHREYSAGDDIRRIDWRVYGRTDKLHLKQFEDESNLTLYIALDVSESMNYRGPNSPLSKLDYAKSMAAALAWIAQTQANAVGLVTFDSELRITQPPSADPFHLKELISQLDQKSPNAKSDFAQVQVPLQQQIDRKSVVYVISDFFDELENVLTLLKSLRYGGHDVVAQQILDPAELEFPFRKTTRFRGLEAGNDLVLAPQRIRRAYLKKLHVFLHGLQRGCNESLIEYRQNHSGENFAAVLSTHLNSRSRPA